MRVLVTGGGGFLGRYVVELLLRRGNEVRIFQRSGADDLAAQEIQVIQGDLKDREALAAAAEGVNSVVHIAAKAGIWGTRRDYFDINVMGTRNVLDACRAAGVRRLVYTSTPSVVFNRKSFSGEDESLPYGRNWLCHYAETKALAEAEVLQANGKDGLMTCALRPHLIWGVGDPHLMPRVIERAASRKLKIVGGGHNLVDITHVRNAARAHIQALDALENGAAAGKAYFLSQGEPVGLWDWVNDMLSRIGIPVVSKRIGAGMGWQAGVVSEFLWRAFKFKGEPPMTRFLVTELSKDHWFSIEAARRDLGYNPEAFTTLQGMEEYAAHIRAERRR